MRTRTTREGEMLDEIAAQEYPGQPEALIALLMANPWVSRHPPMMPAGLVIDLPELEQKREPQTMLRLFD
ncbi:tail protein X [Aquamicrobium sp.]|uniref:tail protein X n=1 Tax=Aquamicrobium sp. TaxID=1872579 RepID=UPI002589FC3F|nr:tail protein X [Aquamicrobium sp.]MCK9549644.1 tail protein X [Aquamicrobium sp.]